MKLLRGLNPIPEFSQGTVATIGNFDGVHKGHQALLTQLKAKSLEKQLPLVVLIFEPQPGEFFYAAKAPARLSSLREKLDLLRLAQVDYVCCLKFNEKLASMEAKQFAQTYFFSLLKVKYLLVGEDFRFGKNRVGDITLLHKLAKTSACHLDVFSNFIIEGERVSSTKIRQALQLGELAYVAQLLGRRYSMCGRVAPGAGKGRQWGIPTANLLINRLALPLTGVFCVQVQRNDGSFFLGVANLGCRPTVDGTRNILEIHLLDFNGNLYGEMLRVSFIHKLRDEKKFKSLEALISQIRKDVISAKAFFNQLN